MTPTGTDSYAASTSAPSRGVPPPHPAPSMPSAAGGGAKPPPVPPPRPPLPTGQHLKGAPAAPPPKPRSITYPGAAQTEMKPAPPARPLSTPSTGASAMSPYQAASFAPQGTMPVAAPSAVPGGAEPKGGAGPALVAHGSTTGPTIMVVEDDPSIRDILVRSLGVEHRVYEASDGQVALDALAELDPPDLLILDVMMPRVDGLTLARTLKAEARTRSIPIIFLTGLDSPKDVVQGINAGARSYLTKPFKIQDLLAKVGKVLGKKK